MKTPLHEAVRMVRPSDDLETLLEAVATAVAASSAFATVAVNLHRPAWDDYEVVAVHGRDEARAALLGATYPAQHWDGLLRDEFRVGDAYLVPAGAFDWSVAPVFIPTLPDARGDDVWHAEDALFAPLYGADGHLLGVISVDEPLSGLRPREEDVQGLVALAAHAALAIQAAQAAADAQAHQAALAQLFRVSSKLNEGESVDDVLQAICDGIREALGFQLVVVETPDYEADRYRPRAAAGGEHEAAVYQIDVPLARLRRVYDRTFEIEGCYLMPREAALARVGQQTETYCSQLNGVGPRAWNRHWLIVPLFDERGREVGFVWADDPSDRLLPSRERLQALRLFADNAQHALLAAERLGSIREAGERQRALVQLSPTGIVLVGTDGRVRDWNDAARALFGYPDDEVIGHYPPWIPDRSGYLERFNAHLERGNQLEAEYTDVCADGRQVRVRTTSAPLTDAAGNVTALIATIVDVTAERQAQEELARQKGEVEALYETTLGLVDRLELDSVLNLIVTHACDLVGGDGGYLYLIDRERGTAKPGVATGMFADRLQREISVGEGLGGMVWETGRPLVVEDYSSWPLRLPEYADVGYHAVAGVPIRAGGEMIGVLGVGLLDESRSFSERSGDLLERFSHLASLALQNARLYDALRRSEELYRKVVDNATDMISLCDAEGTIVFASPSHERFLGYTVEELLGRPFAELVHPDDLPRVMAAVETGVLTSPVRIRHRDGHYLYLDGTPAPLLDAQGHPEGFLSVARDVTERLQDQEERARLEEQLRQSQKMEAIGRLAGGVAHDFNNLLTAIGGYAELASGQLPELSPAQRSLTEIQRAAERAAELTRQLLAYSRKQVLQPKVVDVGEVINGMETILDRLLGSHIELELRLTGASPRTRVDPGQLEQVVMNLAINARDAMPTGGRLVLETSTADLDGESFVLLTVSDSGHGMDEDTLALAFEPFFTTKGPGEGTGLGLSTVYGIVKQTGGHVAAESKPGVGTAVKVYLPREEAETSKEGDGSVSADAGGSPGTVLLVEDEELVRDLVRELLQSAGYTVLTASDGPSALELASKHEGPIDALVTDIVMPGMSGQEVAARLLGRYDGLRVLFTSGYAEDAIATHGELTPGAAFLGKPFSARDLAAKLRELLER